MGLDANTPGAVLYDRFSGNFSKLFSPMKEKFKQSLNIHTLTDSEMVGGWSKHGQPCDRIHALWRMLTDAFEAISLGYNNSIFQRRVLNKINHQTSCVQ